MFKKLVANLPFNPSLISQIAFYTDRLKRERAVRGLSVFFILITMFVQMFAVVVPPQKSLAASDNHILDGLTSSRSAQANKDFLLQTWDSNDDVRAIYSVFGVTREDIAAIEPKQVTVFSGNADYWTIGRNSLYGYSNVSQQYKDSQVTIQYAGLNSATTADDRFVYNRSLRAWDIVNKQGNHYAALQGTIRQTGETFWILYDCGNLTKLTPHTPPPPPPPPVATDPIRATCGIAGPIVLSKDATTAAIPVQIVLPAGASIPKGSVQSNGDGEGLHLSVTTEGTPSTWNKHSLADLSVSPPDTQNDYIPLADGTNGLSYYEFTWDRDNHTYRRYFVTEAKSATFTVTVNVRVNAMDKKLVVRLLDRELGEWLPYSSACATTLSREVPPPPEPPTPALEIRKSILNRPEFLKPNDTYTYAIQYRNTLNASVAENVLITDELDTRYFDVLDVTPATATVSNGFLQYERGALPFSTDAEEIRITVKLKDQISSGTTVCNAGRISADNASAQSTSDICIGVINPCVFDETIPNSDNPNCAAPKLVCSLLDANINRTSRRVTFRTTVSSTNPNQTNIIRYSYDFGDSTKRTVNSTAFIDEQQHTYGFGSYEAKVIVSYLATGVSGEQQVSCSTPIRFEEPPVPESPTTPESPTPPDTPKTPEPPIETPLLALGKSKTVKNLTQDKTGDAVKSSSLKAGDTLEFTLITTNIQNQTRNAITISDYIGDVLDYATLDEASISARGGRYDSETKKIIWENVSIPANTEDKRSFTVTVKNPIPATNSPSGTTTGFDCKISNEYGNEVTINVDCPLVKRIETLPKAGPGTSILLLSAITTIVGYFFARSRLLVKELDIVRHEYALSGGM